MNKHLLLLDSKALVLEWIRFLLWLRKATDSSRDSATVTLELPSYISIISKLPSLNYGHCLVDTTWFDEFIAHLGGGVGCVLSVFWCGTSVMAQPGVLEMCEIWDTTILGFLDWMDERWGDVAGEQKCGQKDDVEIFPGVLGWLIKENGFRGRWFGENQE